MARRGRRSRARTAHDQFWDAMLIFGLLIAAIGLAGWVYYEPLYEGYWILLDLIGIGLDIVAIWERWFM